MTSQPMAPGAPASSPSTPPEATPSPPAALSPPPLPASRSRPAPSITRVFATAFLAITLTLVADRLATWQNARRTQAAMIDLAGRMEQLGRLHPAAGLETELRVLRQLAADAGAGAVRAAIQTTVLSALVVAALAAGLWYSRRRFTSPFARVVTALEDLAGR